MLTLIMFTVLVLVGCLNLFDVPMSTLTKRFFGILLLVCFILWILYDSGFHIVNKL